MGKSGFFITFEGTDGVGKSTHVRLVSEWLRDRGETFISTREPGGGVVPERIRNLLLDPSLSIEPLTELLLYEAARIEHLEKVIRPALLEGKIVLCDRFTDATLAYQGFARGLEKEAALLNDLATKGLKPNLTILLTLPPKIGLERAQSRSPLKKGDRLENEGVFFQQKVQQGYLKLAKREPRRISVVPVQESIDETQNMIRAIIQKKHYGYSGTRTRIALSH